MQSLKKTELKLSQASDQCKAHCLNFKPRRGDVFICTPPKTGTTLMQQICQQIRHPGEEGMQFDDIYQVAPWFDLAFDIGIDLNEFQQSSELPRCFKTHQLLSACPRGENVRYICVVRNPEAVAISWYRFLCNIGIPKATSCANVDEFLSKDEQVITYQSTSLWHFYLEFLHCLRAENHEENVLVVAYEDLCDPVHFRKMLPVISKFLGLTNNELDEQALDTIIRYCSKEVMGSAQNTHKFDETWTYEQLKKVARMSPEMVETYKPATRVVLTKHKEKLSAASIELLKKQWSEIIAARTGIETYEDFLCVIRDSMQLRV